MQIGACRLTFRLPGNDSLKGKRQVARSLITRLRQRFNLAVAEIDEQDTLGMLVVGLAFVSNDAKHIDQVLSAAVEFAQSTHLDATLVEVEREIFEGV